MLRFDDDDPTASKQCNVVLNCGVLPHLCVHCRTHHDWSAGGDQSRGEQIFGRSCRVGGNDSRCCGRDDDDVCALCELRVWNRRIVVPQTCVDFL